MCYPDHDSGGTPELDPTFRNTRREAAIIFCAWVAALLWSVPYCYLSGFGGASIKTVWGIPDWVFWGVAVPWVAASAFALWFSLRVMADDDLGEGGVTEPSTRSSAPTSPGGDGPGGPDLSGGQREEPSP